MCLKCSLCAPLMTCKFERVVTPNGFVVLHISGRIESADVEILRELIEKEERAKRILAIDLTEVTLIGRDAIRACSTVETKGTELRNCPAYICNWVSRENACNGNVRRRALRGRHTSVRTPRWRPTKKCIHFLLN